MDNNGNNGNEAEALFATKRKKLQEEEAERKRLEELERQKKEMQDEIQRLEKLRKEQEEATRKAEEAKAEAERIAKQVAEEASKRESSAALPNENNAAPVGGSANGANVQSGANIQGKTNTSSTNAGESAPFPKKKLIIILIICGAVFVTIILPILIIFILDAVGNAAYNKSQANNQSENPTENTTDDPAQNADVDPASSNITLASDFGYEFQGHTYVFYEDSTEVYTWMECRDDCEAKGGHLVTINSAEEADFLRLNFPDSRAWIGAYNDAFFGGTGEWCWVTGEPFDYTEWAENEPSYSNELEGFGLFWNANNEWNDLTEYDSNNRHYGYICEYE
ncbi:MAG: hypothetical protein K5669_07690 [Lachnospiraceae bacterium]|nr:hypothetical protein [Lachnospiraceae bacterium]